MLINDLYKNESFSKRVELVALINAHMAAAKFDISEDYWRLRNAVVAIKEIEQLVIKEFGYEI